jgi:CRP-like cAMP-binding protein
MTRIIKSQNPKILISELALPCTKYIYALIKREIMFELLFQKLKEKIVLTEEEKELSKTFFTPKKLRKRQYLLQEGDVCKYIAFVEKGILRSYSLDEKGNEHIIQFAFEGWWISDQLSFFTGEPSSYTIDALEDCELLLLSRPAEEQMLEKIPKFERYFRILLQNNLINTQRRLVSSLSHSAEEKYTELLESCPTIPQRSPQHMMASYLGITPETLSRIRKKLASG